MTPSGDHHNGRQRQFPRGLQCILDDLAEIGRRHCDPHHDGIDALDGSIARATEQPGGADFVIVEAVHDDFLNTERLLQHFLWHGCPPARGTRTSRRARGQRNTNAEYLTNGILSHPEKYLTDDDVPNVNLDGCYP